MGSCSFDSLSCRSLKSCILSRVKRASIWYSRLPLVAPDVLTELRTVWGEGRFRQCFGTSQSTVPICCSVDVGAGPCHGSWHPRGNHRGVSCCHRCPSLCRTNTPHHALLPLPTSFFRLCSLETEICPVSLSATLLC